jgi:RNA polymerase sigma factor (sigma-70 family)
MDEESWLTAQFEGNRAHLQAVAYRMLGSLSEADDAVQEAWLHLRRSGTSGVENLGGWLTTVVARVCLDMLRSRTSRREQLSGTSVPDVVAGPARAVDPEHEAEMADSVGLALLVVLSALAPAERLAFVLHDLFALSFDEIAPIVGRSPTAARQLASRARRRVRGADTPAEADRARQREVVDAFLGAAHGGDLDALLRVLDPDVVVRMDHLPGKPSGAPVEIRGAAAVANMVRKGGARAARAALVNGSVGAVVAPRGRLMIVLVVTIAGGKIVAIDAISDPERLRSFELAVLDD